MNSESTHTVVSYEEVKEARITLEQANSEYKRLYKNYLITCLCNSGFANKRVKHKRTGCIGVLTVEEKSYFRPYEIKFYPIRKDGNVSLKVKYHGYYHEGKLVEELTENFELVGDDIEG